MGLKAQPLCKRNLLFPFFTINAAFWAIPEKLLMNEDDFHMLALFICFSMLALYNLYILNLIEFSETTILNGHLKFDVDVVI